jgi:hypothetical protein
VAKKFVMTRGVTQMFRETVTSYRVDRRRNEDIYDIVYEDGDKESMNLKQFSEAYATALANPLLPRGRQELNVIKMLCKTQLVYVHC